METHQYLKWHEGTHYWEVHDNEYGVPYPRHCHSLNGVLTIDPHSTRPHFSHGPEFDMHEEAHDDWSGRHQRVSSCDKDQDYQRRISRLSDSQRDALNFIRKNIRETEASLLEWKQLEGSILATAKDWG